MSSVVVGVGTRKGQGEHSFDMSGSVLDHPRTRNLCLGFRLSSVPQEDPSGSVTTFVDLIVSPS